jgi:hypothetical protein
MGLGYPPPTLSRLTPLGADLGGSRSIGCAWTPRAGNQGELELTVVDVQGRTGSGKRGGG